jgi:hypothetical protein
MRRKMTDEEWFDDIIAEFDREEARIKMRLELRQTPRRKTQPRGGAGIF